MSDINPNELENEVDDDFLLDDLDDLPSFVSLPTGVFLIDTTKGFEVKELMNKTTGDVKKYYSLNATVVDVAELDETSLDSGENPPKIGDMVGFLFDTKNAFGMGNFKLVAKPIAEQFNVSRIGDIRQKSAGLKMMFVVKRRKSKDKNGNMQNNMQIKNVVLI